MKRLMILAAMLAMALFAVAPAQATSFAAPEDQYGVTLCADGVDGGVCYDPTEPVTCDSFALEEEAQAFLDLGLGSESDREALDPDGNGIACDDPVQQRRRSRVLVVLVVAGHRGRCSDVVEEHARAPRVLAQHDVRLAELAQHAQRDVLEVADRRRAHDEAPAHSVLPSSASSAAPSIPDSSPK